MIGILVFPDFQLLDAAGPISVFEIAARYAADASPTKAGAIKSPSIKVLAVTPGPVRSTSGVELVARGLRSSGAISTLIVAGGEGVREAAASDKTLAFVRAMAKRGVRVVFSPRPACSMAAAPPRIGNAPGIFCRPIPK
jgi:transcriptional regulator GlxA family with amidase domain